jgi:hypothetical protein
MRNDVQIVLALALMIGWQGHINGFDNALPTLARKFVLIASKAAAIVAPVPSDAYWITPDAGFAPSSRLSLYYSFLDQLVAPVALEHCQNTGTLSEAERQIVQTRAQSGWSRFAHTLVFGVCPLASITEDKEGHALWIDAAQSENDTSDVPVVVHLHGNSSGKIFTGLFCFVTDLLILQVPLAKVHLHIS